MKSITAATLAASVRGWAEDHGDPRDFLLAVAAVRYPNQSKGFHAGVVAAWIAEEESPYVSDTCTR